MYSLRNGGHDSQGGWFKAKVVTSLPVKHVGLLGEFTLQDVLMLVLETIGLLVGGRDDDLGGFDEMLENFPF